MAGPCIGVPPSGITSGARFNGCEARKGGRDLPTLFRFLAILAILGGIVLGGMVALVTFVEPQPREMSETIPPGKLQPR